MFWWKSTPRWRWLLAFILCSINNTFSLCYCKPRNLGAETKWRWEAKCALRALQAHFISMTCRCTISAWFLCPGGRQFHFVYNFTSCMENSERHLIPLDLNFFKNPKIYTEPNSFHGFSRKCLVHIMRSLIHVTSFIRMAWNCFVPPS